MVRGVLQDASLSRTSEPDTAECYTFFARADFALLKRDTSGVWSAANAVPHKQEEPMIAQHTGVSLVLLASDEYS